MKTAATILLEMFGVDGKIRPAKVEWLLVSLLYTLNKHDLIDEAIVDVSKHTLLDRVGISGSKFIKSLTSSPEFVGLYNKQKALQLLLQMLPEISLIEELGNITIPMDVLTTIINRNDKSNRYRELKRVLKQINEVNLGFYIVQQHSTPINEFIVIKANSKDDIIKILTKHEIQTPKMLDFLLKESS